MFVADGDTLTSAGESAGIDIALQLVVWLAGTERAKQIRTRHSVRPRATG